MYAAIYIIIRALLPSSLQRIEGFLYNYRHWRMRSGKPHRAYQGFIVQWLLAPAQGDTPAHWTGRNEAIQPLRRWNLRNTTAKAPCFDGKSLSFCGSFYQFLMISPKMAVFARGKRWKNQNPRDYARKRTQNSINSAPSLWRIQWFLQNHEIEMIELAKPMGLKKERRKAGLPPLRCVLRGQADSQQSVS